MVGSSEEGEGDHVIARAEYDFAGDILRLAPKGKQTRIRGWLLGTADGLNEGVVPANYVKQTDFGSSSWEEGIKRHQERKCPRITDTTDRAK